MSEVFDLEKHLLENKITFLFEVYNQDGIQGQIHEIRKAFTFSRHAVIKRGGPKNIICSALSMSSWAELFTRPLHKKELILSQPK